MPASLVADAFQYPPNLVSTISEPAVHDLNANGPAPTGLRPKSLPYFWSAVGEMIWPARKERIAGSGEYCWVRVRAIVEASTTVSLLTGTMSNQLPRLL